MTLPRSHILYGAQRLEADDFSAPLDDSDPRKPRPDHWTRQNAAGETFHTYVDPDRCPAMARADEALWRLDHDA